MSRSKQFEKCKDVDIFSGLFLTPEINYCSIIVEFGSNGDYKTFKGSTDSERLLDESQNFELTKGT